MLITCVGLFSEEGIINKLITGVGAEEVVGRITFGATCCRRGEANGERETGQPGHESARGR